jgi:predicted transport protein
MSDPKLFRTSVDGVTEYRSQSVELEKSLQELIEKNLEAILGVRFLASEYVTGKTHGGRIDTLGIDENRCPVIIEYKRSLNQNVINQGLYYLDWLLDHKAEIKILVIDKYGREEADGIDWTGPRLLCIAGEFTRYDEHAVQQIPRNIELLRYRKFGDDLFLLELVNTLAAKSTIAKPAKPEEVHGADNRGGGDKVTTEGLSGLTGPLLDLFEHIRAFLGALGDDVQEKQTNTYIAFKRLKNFVCIEIRKDKLLLFLRLSPETITLEQGFVRDVRTIGHRGTGDLELTIRNETDFEKAKPLLIRSFEES